MQNNNKFIYNKIYINKILQILFNYKFTWLRVVSIFMIIFFINAMLISCSTQQLLDVSSEVNSIPTSEIKNSNVEVEVSMEIADITVKTNSTYQSKPKIEIGQINELNQSNLPKALKTKYFKLNSLTSDNISSLPISIKSRLSKNSFKVLNYKGNVAIVDNGGNTTHFNNVLLEILAKHNQNYIDE